MFGVFRHERNGIVDEETRRRMRLIAPHIRRAAMISKVVSLKQNEAASLTEAMDGLRAGVILVDGDGKILHANVAAHAILDEGCILRASAGRLVSGDARTSAELRAIFAAAAQGDSAAGASAGSASPSAADPAETFVVYVLLLASGRRRRAASDNVAVAAVFIHKAAIATSSPPEIVAQTFKLTMAELRVLFAIVEVGGVPGGCGRARHRADHGTHPSQPRL